MPKVERFGALKAGCDFSGFRVYRITNRSEARERFLG